MNFKTNQFITRFNPDQEAIWSSTISDSPYRIFYCDICKVSMCKKSIKKHEKGRVHLQKIKKKYRLEYRKLIRMMEDNYTIHHKYKKQTKRKIKVLNQTIDNINDTMDNKPIEDDNKEGPEICSICTLYKKNICFTCCGHTCCSYCSLRINRCPICRHTLKNKHKLKMYI